MQEPEFLEEQFEAHRVRLKSVAYRMLGSISEADDALQESWLRVSRSEPTDVDNPAAWLTTVVARVCLDTLRSRRSRREEPFGARLPEPIVSPEDGTSPEQQALLADSVGLALLIVMEKLTPAERLAFVLHDMFGVSFDEIAPIVDRSPAAARQLASRARRRVRGAAPEPDPDLERQREVVDAFLAAAREGDFEGLLAVLDPEVVIRIDSGDGPASEKRGAEAVFAQVRRYRSGARWRRPVLVNGAPGIAVMPPGGLVALLGFTVADGRIVEIDVLADRERLAEIDLSQLSGA